MDGLSFAPNEYSNTLEATRRSDRQEKHGERTAVQRNFAGSFSRRQQLFIRYTFLVLVDLTVLNLFDEYWDDVALTSFSASLLAAILLQALLFGSKLAILGAINVAFGDRVLFLGPVHGALAFVVVVLAMLIAEGMIQRIYLALA
jgi:hypothetical protein